MKNQNPFTYYEQHFTREIRVFYYVLTEGKETPLQIEFTDEVVRDDEEMMGMTVLNVGMKKKIDMFIIMIN